MVSAERVRRGLIFLLQDSTKCAEGVRKEIIMNMLAGIAVGMFVGLLAGFFLGIAFSIWAEQQEQKKEREGR